MNKSTLETALGIIRIAEANMAAAVRFVTSRRGFDPRDFALLSFGGAGGLHACAIAEQLEIPRVIIPPYCGVLSALGMIVAPPVEDFSKTVVHLRDALDDTRLAREFDALSSTGERFADVRFAGQSHELTVPVNAISRASIEQQFRSAYEHMYGGVPDRAIEIVTLRVRRVGPSTDLQLPRRAKQRVRDNRIIDPDASVWIPPGWSSIEDEYGIVVLERNA